jgi:hypothetical protein
MSKNLNNAAPKRYLTKFIEPGLADYTAEGFGKVLVSKEALDKMLQSYVGKPVFLKHNDTDPIVAFSNEGENQACGVVSEVGYDEESGWYWVRMLIWDDETIRCIDEYGWTVSCAYDVLDADGEGGSYHAIDYDQEVLDGEYTHMAIVDNPRYEGATIVQNSKEENKNDTDGGNMKKGKVFKFLGKKKVANEEPEKKPEEKEEVINASDCVEMENGEKVSVEKLVENYKTANSEDSEPEENLMNMDDVINVDGKKVPVSELVAAYNKTKENAEPPTDDQAEDVVDESKQMQNAKTEKKNENFNKVSNAATMDSKPFKPNINTKSTRIERGKNRYSLDKGDK